MDEEWVDVWNACVCVRVTATRGLCDVHATRYVVSPSRHVRDAEVGEVGDDDGTGQEVWNRDGGRVDKVAARTSIGFSSIGRRVAGKIFFFCGERAPERRLMLRRVTVRGLFAHIHAPLVLG